MLGTNRVWLTGAVSSFHLVSARRRVVTVAPRVLKWPINECGLPYTYARLHSIGQRIWEVLTFKSSARRPAVEAGTAP